jgi:hypothetical protein
MKGKVLLNIYTIQVKNDLMSILVQNNYDFLEVNNEDELSFKYNLIKDQLGLYIQELDELNYEKALEQIRKIDASKVKSIILLHKYSSKVIDDALALKVSDIVVLPIDRINLTKKILSSVTKQTSSDYMPASPIIEIIEEIDYSKLNEELNRALRGSYPLSLVTVDAHKMTSTLFEHVKKALEQFLRATDIILPYGKQQLLLLCPFTPKNFLVEVENKVRLAHKSIAPKASIPNAIYLYGVTYPDDGSTSEELLKRLYEGVHDSIVFSNVEGTLQHMNHERLKKQLKKEY